MNDAEESIYDLVLETGLSSNNLKFIRDNIENISKSFIVDILAENVNIYTDLNLLIEFLPIVWEDNRNPSKHLLNYLGGIIHRLFYLAREYPLGKKIPDYLKSEIEDIHQGLHECQKICTYQEINEKEFTIEKIDSFDDLIDILELYPRYPSKLFEMFQIVANLFYQFSINPNQEIGTIDELGLFLSRCLILWRLQSMTDKELIACFEGAEKKYNLVLNSDELENILALELQNYQFLQFGIDRFLVKTIVETFEKMR
ncbi:MAG: hypothetical protein ACTSUP_03375 [Candidatus Heimdallarchaeaceae archaeon]